MGRYLLLPPIIQHINLCQSVLYILATILSLRACCLPKRLSGWQLQDLSTLESSQSLCSLSLPFGICPESRAQDTFLWNSHCPAIISHSFLCILLYFPPNLEEYIFSSLGGMDPSFSCSFTKNKTKQKQRFLWWYLLMNQKGCILKLDLGFFLTQVTKCFYYYCCCHCNCCFLQCNIIPLPV